MKMQLEGTRGETCSYRQILFTLCKDHLHLLTGDVIDLQGASKTARVGEPRPRLCLLCRLHWFAALCQILLLRLLLFPTFQVVVLSACARALAVSQPALSGLILTSLFKRLFCICLAFTGTTKSNECYYHLLVSRFDEGDAGRSDRDGRSAATDFCHNHLLDRSKPMINK